MPCSGKGGKLYAEVKLSMFAGRYGKPAVRGLSEAPRAGRRACWLTNARGISWHPPHSSPRVAWRVGPLLSAGASAAFWLALRNASSITTDNSGFFQYLLSFDLDCNCLTDLKLQCNVALQRKYAYFSAPERACNSKCSEQ